MGPTGSGSRFELDTKGICLLCLRKCCPDKKNGLSSFATSQGDKGFQSFKLLMRYLNIDLLEQCNFSKDFLERVDGFQREVEMAVKLCSVCLKVCLEFGRIFEQFEMIRLQLDECVKVLFQKMETGDKNKDRVKEYNDRCLRKEGWNPGTLFHASVADNLRRETLRKCSLKVDKLIPRVTVTKSESQFDNLNDYPDPDADPICVITETKGDLENDLEFQGPTSMLKLETIYCDGRTSSLSDEILTANQTTGQLEDSNDSSYMDPLSYGGGPLSPEWTPNGRYPHSTTTSGGTHPQDTSTTTKKTVALKRTGGGARRGGSRGGGSIRRRAGSQYTGPTYKCPVCRKDFTVLSCMKRHHKIFHMRQGGNQFRCNFCDKDFLSRFNMIVHINSVHLYEAHLNRLPPGVTKLQLKATVNLISKEQGREWQSNRGKVAVRCAFCGKLCAETFFFKTHLVEKHFEVVVNRLNGGEVDIDTILEDADSSSNHLLRLDEEMEGAEEEEIPMENFMNSSVLEYVTGGDATTQENKHSEASGLSLEQGNGLGERFVGGREGDGGNDVPPQLDLYGALN